MANPNVLFSRGSSVTFPALLKDPNTLYFITDTKEMYLGSERYAFGQDINITITGVGDTVSNASWNAGTKTLVIALGDAAETPSVREAIESAISTCVKSISSDRGSSIIVDSTDSQNPKLSLNIAQDSHAGNVKIEECSDGLRASVEFPEVPVQGVKSGDKVLKLNDDKQLETQLSVTTVTESGVVYVVLKGIDGQEISRFDASEFVKDGMLDSVSLEYASDGSNHRILVFVFNTVSGKETIKIDVQEFIDTYTAEPGGGLKLTGNAFSIENQVSPSDVINTDVAPGFGETITLNAIKYDGHGLITGKGTFRFTLPEISGGSVGGTSKLISYVGIDTSGVLSGETLDVSTALSVSSTDAQIPTAKAVYDAIDEAKTRWERF